MNLTSFREHIPANTYLFKVHDRNTRKRREISSKLTIKTPERRQRRISHLFLVLLLIVDFEQINVSWKSRLRNFEKKTEIKKIETYFWLDVIRNAFFCVNLLKTTKSKSTKISSEYNIKKVLLIDN